MEILTGEASFGKLARKGSRRWGWRKGVVHDDAGLLIFFLCGLMMRYPAFGFLLFPYSPFFRVYTLTISSVVWLLLLPFHIFSLSDRPLIQGRDTRCILGVGGHIFFCHISIFDHHHHSLALGMD